MSTEFLSRSVMFAGGGIAAWIGFRMYVRSEVLRELLNSRIIEKMSTLNTLTNIAGVDLNLPTAQRLAESIVPIWSSVMPRSAIQDLLVSGRMSRYWPDEYRTGGDLSIFEPVLLQLGRRLSAAEAEV